MTDFSSEIFKMIEVLTWRVLKILEGGGFVLTFC